MMKIENVEMALGHDPLLPVLLSLSLIMAHATAAAAVHTRSIFHMPYGQKGDHFVCHQ